MPARLVRGETLSLRVREYVQAVRVMGGSGGRIVLRHIIPNTIGTIIVNATFQVADAILLLAALGFIGLGVPAPQTDWGSMLSDGVNYALNGYWWEIYPAGVAIVLVVVAFNFVGDALRDAFEVRLQRALSDATSGVCSGKWQAARCAAAERAERRLDLGADRPARAGSGCGSGSPTAESIADGSSPRTCTTCARLASDRVGDRRPRRSGRACTGAPRGS